MNYKKLAYFLLAVFAVGFSVLSCSQPQANQEEKKAEAKKAVPTDAKWSERMALSIMKRNPEAWQIDLKKKPKWDYVHGLALLAFQKLYNSTGNEAYYAYAKQYADELIDSVGTIKKYKIEKYNIDMVNAGKILFDLYAKEKDERYLTAMKTLRKQLQDHPRTKDGGFWHKKRYTHQMWLDGLYMGAPFYAQYEKEFGDSTNWDDIAKQFDLIQQNAYDKETGLLYHGWDESRQMAWADKETGCSPNFWSRSLGWYAMALVDVLDFFPADHPKQKDLVAYLNQLAEALVKFQDESGLWYQVTNMGDKEGNYLEASGSSMFAYAFAKGANKGYLPAKYKDIANKAFDGLTQKLIKVEDDGEIHLTEVCAVAGLGGKPFRDGSYEYYINERKKDNDPKGTGPFILAALELDR